MSLGNRLITTISTLTREFQLTTVFGPEYANVEGIHAHANLLLKSRILHNMVTQMIILRIGQTSKVTYMDLWPLTYILLGKSINQPYIMLTHLIKMYSNHLIPLYIVMCLSKYLRHRGLMWKVNLKNLR